MQCQDCKIPMTKLHGIYEPQQGQFEQYDVYKCWKCGAVTESED